MKWYTRIMINTKFKFYATTFVVLVAMIIGSAAAEVASTGDARCLFVKCVIVK